MIHLCFCCHRYWVDCCLADWVHLSWNLYIYSFCPSPSTELIFSSSIERFPPRARSRFASVARPRSRVFLCLDVSFWGESWRSHGWSGPASWSWCSGDADFLLGPSVLQFNQCWLAPNIPCSPAWLIAAWSKSKFTFSCSLTFKINIKKF